MDTKINRRDLLRGIAALAAESALPGGATGFLRTLADQHMPELTPTQAEIIAWEYLLTGDELITADSTALKNIPRDYRQWVGKNTAFMRFAVDFDMDMERLAHAPESWSDGGFHFFGHDAPMPGTITEFVDAIAHFATEVDAWNARTHQVAKLVGAYPEAVKAALTRLDTHIFRGELSEFDPEGWMHAWDPADGIDLFTAQPGQIDTFFAEIKREDLSQLWSSAARVIGPQHLPEEARNAIDPQELAEIEAEMAKPGRHRLLFESPPEKTLIIDTAGAQKDLETGDGVAEIYPLCAQDGATIPTEMLDHILWKIAQSDAQRIIIVHSDNALPLNAAYLKRRLGEYGDELGMGDKTILLATRATEKTLREAAQLAPGMYRKTHDGPQEAEAYPRVRGADCQHSGTVADAPTRSITP